MPIGNKDCTLPEEANRCTKAACSRCGWDAAVLAARKKLLATQGLTPCGKIYHLALPRKENANDPETSDCPGS